MEPATKQDLKDLLMEFREEFRRGIREAVAAGFGNSKPALEQATTPAASQLLSTDAPASPTTIVDVVPVLAASSASAKSLDFDATGVAAPAPTICSTDGIRHNADEDDHMAAWQATWSVPTSFTKSLEVSPTEACQLSVDFKLDNLAPAECSMKCFVETPCALTPMFMPEVTESIKQQGHVLRPLPWPSFVQSQDEGQLNDTRSLESWFGFCVTEAWVSRFLGLTLGDDTSYGAYKNIIPCRSRFQAKLHEDDCCSALSFALHTTSSCIVVYSQVLSEMRLLYFELPGIGMSWTYVQLIGASGRLFPALESVATSIVFMSRETDEVQPWAYPFCMENLLLICPCSQPTSLQFRSSLKLGFSLATLISLHYVRLTVEGATGYLHSLQPKPPWLSNVPVTFIQVAIEVEKRGVQNLAEQQKERAQMTELLKQQLNHANQKMKHRAGANGAEFMSGVRVHGCDQISDFLHEKQTAYSCAKLVAPQLLVSARTECWIPLLLIHAYLGGFCRLKWDIRITMSSSFLVAIVQDVARGAFFNWGMNYLECLSRKFVLGAINMSYPISLTSKLCTAGGIIFTSSGPLISLRNCEQIIYLESTSATYAGFLPDQIASLYSAQTVAVFGGSLGTASPLPCHCSIAEGAQYPYACCVRDITPLELRAECSECLLTDLVMRNSCTVPYITPAAPSNMFDLLNTSPREIYSRLIPVWVAPLLASKSASGCHLELSWDPGGNISSVWTSQSLEENASCRGMLIGGQNSVDAMEFSSSYKQALFQGGRSITVPASSTTTTTLSLSSTTTSSLSSTTTSMMLTSSTSLKSTSTNAHHCDYGSTMERHVPWDPGGNGTASAWGRQWNYMYSSTYLQLQISLTLGTLVAMRDTDLMQWKNSLLLSHALFLEFGTYFALEMVSDNDKLGSEFVQWEIASITHLASVKPWFPFCYAGLDSLYGCENFQWIIAWSLGSHFPVTSLQTRSACVIFLVQQNCQSTSTMASTARATRATLAVPKGRQAQWNSDGNSLASAWGQAEFQEGRGVSDLSNWYKYMGWFLGSAHGPSPFVNCWELQV